MMYNFKGEQQNIKFTQYFIVLNLREIFRILE